MTSEARDLTRTHYLQMQFTVHLLRSNHRVPLLDKWGHSHFHCRSIGLKPFVSQVKLEIATEEFETGLCMTTRKQNLYCYKYSQIFIEFLSASFLDINCTSLY